MGINHRLNNGMRKVAEQVLGNMGEFGKEYLASIGQTIPTEIAQSILVPHHIFNGGEVYMQKRSGGDKHGAGGSENVYFNKPKLILDPLRSVYAEEETDSLVLTNYIDLMEGNGEDQNLSFPEFIGSLEVASFGGESNDHFRDFYGGSLDRLFIKPGSGKDEEGSENLETIVKAQINTDALNPQLRINSTIGGTVNGHIRKSLSEDNNLYKVEYKISIPGKDDVKLTVFYQGRPSNMILDPTGEIKIDGTKDKYFWHMKEEKPGIVVPGQTLPVSMNEDSVFEHGWDIKGQSSGVAEVFEISKKK